MAEETLNDLKAEIAALLEKLKYERDELKLQIHLAKANAHDEWERMEGKWDTFHDKAAAVGETAADASKDVAAATRILGGELKKGYERIREAIAAGS